MLVAFPPDKKDVAVKVKTPGDWVDAELHAQESIVQNVQDTSHLVTYLDTFKLPGINHRVYRVLVLPFMGPCLDYILVKKYGSGKSHVCCPAITRDLRGFTKSWNCTQR